MYRGSQCTFRVTGLSAGTEYRVRVHAVRQQQVLPDLPASATDLIGTPSFATSFATLAHRSLRASAASASLRSPNVTPAAPPRFTDQQWALLLLLSFALVAFVVAYLTQQVISYATGSSGGTDAFDLTAAAGDVDSHTPSLDATDSLDQ